ncbi:11863_t:CDS:2, partial [Dentiscutata heterogama]
EDSVASVDDIGDSTSEESEDFSLVEFNSYEIKNKISNDNIQNEKLDPQDLLSNGIVNHTFLQKYHKRLFDLIMDQDCLNELMWNKAERRQYKTSREDAKKFYNCLEMFLTQLEYVWELPLYRQKSPKITEYSYSHQVVKSICDLLLYNIKGIDVEYNGPSESTQNRNGGQSGPTHCPDLMVSKSFRSPNHKWEFMFCEISYGPYSFNWKHYWKDELRLGKFSKDSYETVLSNAPGKVIRDTTYKQQRTKDNTDVDIFRRIQSINQLLLEKNSPTTPPNLVDCDNLLPTFITPDGPVY